MGQSRLRRVKPTLTPKLLVMRLLRMVRMVLRMVTPLMCLGVNLWGDEEREIRFGQKPMRVQSTNY